MTDQEFFEQAERDRLELEQRRVAFMADNSPVTMAEAWKLMEIADKLKRQDTSLNVYELYKHPEARSKLFGHVAEACYMVLGLTATQEQISGFCDYLENRFKELVKIVVSSTDKEALGSLLDYLELNEDTEKRLIKDVAVSGLLSN